MPLGDRHGTPFKDGVVTTPPGWKEAYRAWAGAGWNGLAAPGRMGRPGPAALDQHRLQSKCGMPASMAFVIGPVLTMAAFEALPRMAPTS